MMLISISANPGCFASPARNCLSSSPITVQSCLAIAVAVRGNCVIAAISPKICPWVTVSIVSWPAARPTSPFTSRYILSR
ncbi:hypothetical protein D3C83_45850 [compost metagenome]